MDYATVLDLMGKHGVPLVIAAVFLVFAIFRMKASDEQTLKREERMLEQAAKDRSYITEEVMLVARQGIEAAVQSKDATQAATEVMRAIKDQAKDQHDTLRELVVQFKARPCQLSNGGPNLKEGDIA